MEHPDPNSEDDQPTVEAAPEPNQARAPEPTRSRRRWLWVGAGIVAVALVAVAVWTLLSSTSDNGATATTTINTATVQRTDLVVTDALDGTLGYGDGEAIVFRSSPDGIVTIPAGTNGTITWIAEEGTVVAEGEVLFEVNGEPVVVLYGDIPVYRTLSTRSTDGADIQQLEEALVRLGYDPDEDIEIDEDFTTATREAIELLQLDIGANDDGAFQLGEMLFAPGPLYIADALVEIGDSVQTTTGVISTSAALSGTVTATAEEGAIVAQGDQLFWVDERPVTLLIGSTPAYRTLSLGVSGNDVLQLETALVELGYADAGAFAVDGTFDQDTQIAVIEWQRAIGAQTDGVVNLGEVVFQPASIRVGSLLLVPGDSVQNGQAVLETSASETFVTVELSTGDQDLVAEGDSVSVELPDGSDVSATITSIGTVALTTAQGDSYFEMIVVIDDPEATAFVDEAPVDVEIVSDSATNALAIPVTALIALSEGGYAVQVVTESGLILVGVDPGLFADGLVEVTTDGLQPGVEVVIP